MKVRKIAILLVLGVILALGLAACGERGTTPDQPATTQATGGQPATTGQTGVTTPQGGGVAADDTVMGRLMAANPVAQSWPLTTTPGPHFSLLLQVGGATMECIIDNEFTHWYQEQTGVEVDWIVIPSGLGQEITLRIAAGDLPDGFIGGIGTGLLQELALLDNILMPMTDAIFNYAPNIVNMLMREPQAFEQSFLPDGNIYQLLRVYDTPNEQITKRAWVYQPWLELLNMDLPQTTEEFYVMLTRFRDEIPALTGIPEVVPFAGALQGNPANNEPTTYILNSFHFYSHGNNMMRRDGVVSFVAGNEDYREGLRFLRRLVESNLLTTETWTINRNGLMAMTEGQAHGQNILGAVTAMYWGHFTTEGGPLGRDTSFVSLPVLEGPNGVRLAYDRGLLVNGGMLTLTNPDIVDLAIQFYDWMFCPFSQLEYGWSSKLGREGLGWRHAEPGELTPLGTQATLAFLRPNDARQRDAWFGSHAYYWPFEFTMGVVDDFMNRKESFGGQETIYNYQPWSAFEYRLPFVWTPFELLEEFQQLQTHLVGGPGIVRQYQNRFILGELCLDNDWDAYLASLQRGGIDRLVEIWQIKYDLYRAQN